VSIYENHLHMEAEDVILRPGDLVIDHTLNCRGFLIKRKRYIDMIEDDIFIWEVNWFKYNDASSNTPPTPSFLEEEGLKLSIVVGTVELYGKDGKAYIPEYISEE
jgi:hypothetical protein